MATKKVYVRREFLRHSGLMLGGIGVLSHERSSLGDPGGSAQEAISIQQVINLIIKKCAGTPLRQTVDTVKTGDPARKVEGIVTTFMATRAVVEKAVQLRANFIITHEPTFWNHTDDTDWLSSDAVYLSKRRLIDENKIVIWRCHDYWHHLRPDPVVTGLLKELGWEKYAEAEYNSLCTIPATNLRDLAAFLKERLKLQGIQAVGKMDMPCRHVAILVGASPGRPQIGLLGKPNIDVIIAGDINEWEGCEYARDASQGGINKGFLVLGHESTEEPGMKYLAEWLRPLLPGIKISHVPAASPFVLL